MQRSRPGGLFLPEQACTAPTWFEEDPCIVTGPNLLQTSHLWPIPSWSDKKGRRIRYPSCANRETVKTSFLRLERSYSFSHERESVSHGLRRRNPSQKENLLGLEPPMTSCTNRMTPVISHNANELIHTSRASTANRTLFSTSIDANRDQSLYLAVKTTTLRSEPKSDQWRDQRLTFMPLDFLHDNGSIIPLHILVDLKYYDLTI
jgi:hypothetical protein